jgi:hypothetical protein
MDPEIRTLLENVQKLINDLLLERDEPIIEPPQKNLEEPEELLSIKQIIKQYYITEPTFKKYRDLKIIRPVNDGRRPFFRRKDILHLMQNLKPNKYPGHANNLQT